MGCVLDLVRGVLASIKRGHPKRGREHSSVSYDVTPAQETPFLAQVRTDINHTMGM